MTCSARLERLRHARQGIIECHDRGNYVPDNADANVVIIDIVNVRHAVNDEIRLAIAEYNRRRAVAGAAKKAKSMPSTMGDTGKPKRFRAGKYANKPHDCYLEVKNGEYSNGRRSVVECALQFGRAETHGVCDDPFDGEECEECLRPDNEDGCARTGGL